MGTMTHRERVLAALAHEQPDRVPLDLGSTRDSSIVVEAYEPLKAHFGVTEENVLISRMMCVVDVNEAILQALDIDTRGVFPAAPPDVIIDEYTYRDEWGVERVRPPGSHYYDEVFFPLAGEITIRDIASYPWPDPHDPIRRRRTYVRIFSRCTSFRKRRKRLSKDSPLSRITVTNSLFSLPCDNSAHTACTRGPSGTQKYPDRLHRGIWATSDPKGTLRKRHTYEGREGDTKAPKDLSAPDGTLNPLASWPRAAATNACITPKNQRGRDQTQSTSRMWSVA